MTKDYIAYELMAREPTEFRAMERMGQLEFIANKFYDGAFTVIKVAAQWRVGFIIPQSKEDLLALHPGKTFVDAADEALLEAFECIREAQKEKH